MIDDFLAAADEAEAMTPMPVLDDDASSCSVTTETGPQQAPEGDAPPRIITTPRRRWAGTTCTSVSSAASTSSVAALSPVAASAAAEAGSTAGASRKRGCSRKQSHEARKRSRLGGPCAPLADVTNAPCAADVAPAPPAASTGAGPDPASVGPACCAAAVNTASRSAAAARAARPPPPGFTIGPRYNAAAASAAAVRARYTARLADARAVRLPSGASAARACQLPPGFPAGARFNGAAAVPADICSAAGALCAYPPGFAPGTQFGPLAVVRSVRQCQGAAVPDIKLCDLHAACWGANESSQGPRKPMCQQLAALFFAPGALAARESVAAQVVLM